MSQSMSYIHDIYIDLLRDTGYIKITCEYCSWKFKMINSFFQKKNKKKTKIEEVV